MRARSSRLVSVNTYGISLTITTGIAPLLFIQLIYQPFFYSGTILLGWIWFGLLVLLIAGYYATYLYKFRGAPSRGAGGGFWLGAAAIAFLLIAMIQVAAHLIHVQPGGWAGYAESAWSVLGDATYWPRLAHFVLAAVGFSALVIGWWAARQAAAGTEVAVNAAIARSCWTWAVWTTVLQAVDGFVLLFLLPQATLVGLMRGGLATLGPLTLSIVLAIGLVVMMARPIDPVAKRRLITGSLAAMTLVIAIMVVTRDQVRNLYLAPAATLQPAVASQWGNFLLFVVLLLAALGTVGYMTRRVLVERAVRRN
jgi:hypothetical protein